MAETKIQILGRGRQSGTGTQPDEYHTNGCSWVYVPKWALQGFAWFVIIMGGVSATVSLFLDATILGLPAGAVLGALGIWLGITGSGLLWLVDNYYQSQYLFICW